MFLQSNEQKMQQEGKKNRWKALSTSYWLHVISLLKLKSTCLWNWKWLHRLCLNKLPPPFIYLYVISWCDPAAVTRLMFHVTQQNSCFFVSQLSNGVKISVVWRKNEIIIITSDWFSHLQMSPLLPLFRSTCLLQVTMMTSPAKTWKQEF